MRAASLWLAALLLVPTTAWAYDVDLIQSGGDPANRIDIAILGDGYRTQDQEQLTSDVNDAMAAFWQHVPFDAYKEYFNVKLVHVISNEEGADNGSYGSIRDTALGAYFNCEGIERLLCVDDGAVYSVAGADVPEFDFLIVIVNDPKYGGSGGAVGVFSNHPDAGELVSHEFGHTFAGLADEYVDPYPGYPPCGSDCPEPNVTARTVRGEVKWNTWIDLATPVPTPEPYADVIGLFEGARYATTGVFRPTQDCLMRSLDVPYCAICVEADVRSVYQRVDPIDATSPVSPLTLDACDSVTLSFTHPTRVPDTLFATWSLDGVVVANGSDSFLLQGSGLSAGNHELRLDVMDQTSDVRNDPSNLLRSDYTWMVDHANVAGCDCVIAGIGYAAGALNPANPCQECNTARSSVAWTDDDSNACDDGTFCNGPDTCQAGVCSGAGDPCAGPDADGDCVESCDETLDDCTANDPDDAACDDELHCNGADTCQAGVCSGHAGDPCAGPDADRDCAESCDEMTDDCTANDPDNSACDDAMYCNGWDTCQAGVCADHTGDPCARPGGDDDCAESCNETKDDCTANDPEGSPCDDARYCNGIETCTRGVCGSSSGDPCPGADGDRDCHESCDEVAGRCTRYDGDEAPCDRGFCAGGECQRGGGVGDAGTGDAGATDTRPGSEESGPSRSGMRGEDGAAGGAALRNFTEVPERGCGCRVVSSPQIPNSGFVFALGGLASMLARRRRRRAAGQPTRVVSELRHVPFPGRDAG